MMMMGFLTFLGLFLLLIKLSPNTLKKLIGANFSLDLIITGGLVVLFGITGTISGMMTGLIAGLMVSVVLWVAKLVIPHKTLKMDGLRPRWVDQEPALVRKLRLMKEAMYK